jgi:hypothetical protein
LNNKRIGSESTVSLNVIPMPESGPQVSAETVSLLEELLEEAKAGSVVGLAIVILRTKRNYDLELRGVAADSGEQISVAGMLAALQKMVLELSD